MTAPCTVCGTASPLIEHHFFTGNPERPERRWSYMATLWHDGETKAVFCGPKCSLEWVQQNRGKK